MPSPATLPGRAGLLLASLLVLPLAVLLFAQWPLRELVRAWSREANDFAQICFALYMAAAVTAASLTHSHMAAHTPLQMARHPTRRWRETARRWALLACLAPWALFMLWAAAPQIRDSVMGLEKFSENFTPGYFVIKLALALMLVLVLLDVLAHAVPTALLQCLSRRRAK